MRRIMGCVLVLAVVATPAPALAERQAEPTPVVLRVMTFNILYGATETHGLDEVIEAIRAAHADVVGMQEPYARLRRIAAALDFHVSPRMHVISRYPILEPGGSDGHWAFLLLAPGRVAAIMNTHLPAQPYTPYRIVNRGFDRARVLEQERHTRLRRIHDELAALEPLMDAGLPIFFTGDFNSPSHRDWTREVVRARGLPYPVRWPVSSAMEEAGFRDSYREVHPDPVADAGFTWTPGYPAPFVHPWEVFDRIDFVWAFGPAITLDSRVVGESQGNADVVVTPWPSDHRGVVSTFEVTPAPAPTLVAAPERSRLGNPLEASFHTPGEPGEHVLLVAAGGDAPVQDLPTGPAGTTDGVLTFDTVELGEGAYDLVLRNAGGAELARDRVVLVADGQLPLLHVADDTLEGDQVLEVSWSYAPGNRYDWLGIFVSGISAKQAPIERWRYMRAAIDGMSRIGPHTRGAGPWPLPPGEYDVRICLDDSYRCRVSTPFTVLG